CARDQGVGATIYPEYFDFW
nr:immunoglobulin heavy chain junction region [Macaca mulatta]MOV87294.1 immunoglobulin heavy chain junction region [Macaca mulatta]MOV88780.1 immunoglobulin heavy chain junction region [Macaca mulatta]MOV89037.1 immunoglobulin heavy chain junction region [Macaca mulatta]MOV91965.1 immunoglobulin heavy chain junction region [Macaca mulatta]